MVFRSVPELHLGGVLIAGLVAGYVMAMAGLWAGRIPRLAAVDIADFGRRYMVSDRPSAWFFGLASHLVNSVLLVMLWASVFEPNLDWPRWLEGMAFGAGLAIVLAGVLVAPMAGLGLMGRKTGGPAFAITNVLVHLLWGLLVGSIYVPK